MNRVFIGLDGVIVGEDFAGTLLRFENGFHWPEALDVLSAHRQLVPRPNPASTVGQRP